MGLKFAKIKGSDVSSPVRAGKKEAGIDFFIPNDFEEIILVPGDSILIDMKIKVRLPEVPETLKGTHEYLLKFDNKSGIAYKEGLVVGSCIIDTTYQGSLHLNLHNNTSVLYKSNGDAVANGKVTLFPGMKIVQGIILLCNIEEIEESNEDELFSEVTQRGSNGFGSNYKEK